MTSRRLVFSLRCVFSLLLIAFILRKVDWRLLLGVVYQINPFWALVASALTGILVIGFAVRWRLFLRAKGIPLPAATILFLTWAGQFFNAVLPGSTGGDILKVYQVCRLNPERRADAAATVLVDRLTALFALLLLAGIGVILNPLALGFLKPDYVFSFRLMWCGAALLLLAGAGRYLLARTQRGILWGGRVLRTLQSARSSVSWRGHWAAAFAWALAMHLVTVLIAYLFAKSLGLSISLVQMLIVVPVVAVFVMLPITINGHGLREILLIAYFTQFNVTVVASSASVREAAVAFSLVMVANDLLWALPGGMLYLFKIRSITSAGATRITDLDVS
jgi:glycosyltransferase 2 family protein